MGCYTALRCADLYFHFIPVLQTTSGTIETETISDCFFHFLDTVHPTFLVGKKMQFKTEKNVNSCLEKIWIVSGCLELYDFMSLNYHSLNKKHLTWRQINGQLTSELKNAPHCSFFFTKASNGGRMTPRLLHPAK